jgi:hypothetical protein
MIFQPRKAALYKLAIQHGLRSPAELMSYLPLGSSVPNPRLESWLQWLFRPPKHFSSRRRYVNQFKIGADPEFVFANTVKNDLGEVVGSTRCDAQTLGMSQGPAFGVDNNGRLAEIRPHPSRSAVEVVASILTTFRWMVLCMPKTLQLEWRAEPYLWDDGLGGHVHFGRKRPTRKEEVAALDMIEEGLVHLGVYPKDQVIRRRQGDARRQIYGALGDFRLQQHGYEYRTFPSWLDSPELAFFTLVVAKLAVQMPGLYRFTGGDAAVEQARLRNFLAYFKGVDDDARLALILLERGIPRQGKGHFGPRWGIEGRILRRTQPPAIITPSIKPDAGSISEVFDYLLTGKPLGFRHPTPTWMPTEPPKGYTMCLQNTHTVQAKGLGEMIWDICCSDKMPVNFVQGHRDSTALIFDRMTFAKFLTGNWRDKFEGHAALGDLGAGRIASAPEWREGSRAVWLKKALLNGLLPVWRVKDVHADSYELWLKQTQSVIRKFIGSVLYASQKIPL